MSLFLAYLLLAQMFINPFPRKKEERRLDVLMGVFFLVLAADIAFNYWINS